MFLAPIFFRGSRRDSSEQGSVVNLRDRRERETQRRAAEKDQAKKVVWGYMVK